MSDPAEYRSRREERIWQERDPIKHLRHRLLLENRTLAEKLGAIDLEVEADLEDALKFAEESPEPSMDQLGKAVYQSESGDSRWR